MIAFIIALLLVAVALLTLVLEKTYFYMPRKELKRQAAQKDELAGTLFRAAAYGNELKLVLWIIMGLSAAGGFVLFARVAPGLFGFIVIALLLWLGFVWLPRTRLTMAGARLAQLCTPAIVELMRTVHPVTRRLAAYAHTRHAGQHTQLYEAEDLEELLERQHLQSDNRIDGEALARMRRVLQFGRYHVGDITVPRKQVIAVNGDDDLSPIMLDELHHSGHPRFPVYEGKATNVIGTLPLDVVADTKHRGQVRSYADTHLAYLHENDTLEDALQAFYTTRQHLCIVINGADNYVGVITLTDVLQHLAGPARTPGGTRYDDRQAALHRHRRQPPPEPVKPVPSDEAAGPSNTVIE